MILSVIISVGSGPGLMPPLPGAYTGHDDYKQWAVTQGHDVLEFSDRNGSQFSAIHIVQAIQQKIPFLSGLYIYFAGHGECSGLDRDYWLIKKTDAITGDVIDVGKTATLAQRLGIPRVVIISDACRTMGDVVSLALHEIAAAILPASVTEHTACKVDRLFATGPAAAALEVRQREGIVHSYGVFTSELMKCLRGEVPNALERNHAGDQMVVTPRKLAAYLPERVQEVAALLPNGFPQRPELIFQSQEPFATGIAVPTVKMTVRTFGADRSLLSGTQIEIYNRVDHQWSLIDSKSGPEAEFELAGGLIIKTAAKGPETMVPNPPLPLIEIENDVEGEYVVETTQTNLDTLSASPLLVTARIETDDGQLFAAAPESGVFRVRTTDRLTGRSTIDLQEFRIAGELPYAVRSNSDGTMIRNIAKTANISGRRSFETATGLTLVLDNASSETITPAVAAKQGLLDQEPFQEFTGWQLRAAHSGMVVVRIHERYFPLPIFHRLVGTARIVIDEDLVPSLRELTYAPSENTMESGDLNVLAGTENAITESGREELDATQILVTEAARNGFFDVAIDRSLGLADRTRMLKHRNPIFGLIAAYAYFKGGRTDQVVDMIDWFIRKHQSIPFDLVMLANLTEEQIRDRIVRLGQSIDDGDLRHWIAPVCPMLTQGWAELTPETLERFSILAEIRNALVPGFWTTLSGDTGKKLFELTSTGEIAWI